MKLKITNNTGSKSLNLLIKYNDKSRDLQLKLNVGGEEPIDTRIKTLWVFTEKEFSTTKVTKVDPKTKDQTFSGDTISVVAVENSGN